MSSTEDSPLLSMSPDPSRSSTTSLVRTNLFGGATVLIAQIALLVFGITLWQIIGKHPAGLFTYHPLLQSIAVLLFIEGLSLLLSRASAADWSRCTPIGILVLQPTKTAPQKRTGLALHQVFQLIAIPIGP